MDPFSLGANECLGITKTTTKLKILGQEDEIEVSGGEIIKILRLASLGACFIKLYKNGKHKILILSDETYSCNQNDIKIINEKLGSMLITIGDLVKRLMICNSSDNERFLTNLKLNDLVKVNKYVLKRDHHVVCIIKYIGPVPEIGPGTYVGCTLFDETDTIDENKTLAKRYFNFSGASGFIRNCGCFFTRTMLLDQHIDNLMKIVEATNRKKSNKVRPVGVLVPELKNIATENKILDNTTINAMEPLPETKLQTPPVTVSKLPSNNQIPQLPQTKIQTPPATVPKPPSNNQISQLLQTKTQTPPATVSKPPSNNQIPQLPQTKLQTPPATISKQPSNNQIPQRTVFSSAYVYPETPAAIYSETSTNYYYRPSYPMQYNTTAEMRSSQTWATAQYNIPLPNTSNAPPQPKKNRCSVM